MRRTISDCSETLDRNVSESSTIYGWVASKATSAAAPDITSPLAAIHLRQATASTSSSPKPNASPGLEKA